MNKTSFLTAKTFLKMAECDRKMLLVTGTLNTILTVSLIIKLIVSAICTFSAIKK
ncbi:MAG: hypothetical protein IJ447_07315 [Clostridia bacterium]|nr:hypothetical protein [Clostridia bacterium]